MSDFDIDLFKKWYRTDWRDKMDPILQQTRSVFEQYVTVGSYTGENAQPVKSIGSVEFSEIQGEFTDTELTNVEHMQRFVGKRRFAVSLPITENVAQNMMSSTGEKQSQYKMEMKNAYQRKIDSIIVPAFSGIAYTGESMGTEPVTLPASQIVAVDYGSAGTATGLTYEKIAQAVQILQDNEADIDAEQPLLVNNPAIERQLKKLEEFKNADYIALGQDMSNYKANNPYGTKLIRSTKLNRVNVGTTANPEYHTECYLYLKSGMHLAFWKELKFKVGEIAMKNFDMVAQAQFWADALRLQEEKVVKIICKEG